ncbi:MAG: homocysteine S-methyltransferase family protein [Deltaproteobacteria bacterium]|nr:homocysteine S-methyltransferase family protein [Deltaproteobacteria bacterium]
MTIRDEKILLFDGACGTSLQRMEIPASAWQGRDGCNEFLNVSAPEVIREWHASFLSAGAMVLETNTFGANRIVLAEYGLEHRVGEINRAAVENAREAIRRTGTRAYVAGSIGPTTKLPSLGHIAYEPLAAAVAEQARELLSAGADLLILETCQDLLQVKIALVSCFETLEASKRDVPVMVSLTVESTGTMLVGTDVAAALAAIEPFPVFSIGLNCATGPEGMTSHIRHLCRNYPGRVSCMPNAGIPQVSGGKTLYPLSPEAFAARLSAFVRDEGVSIVGGCCGTAPEHIRALRDALRGVEPAAREVSWKPALSSLYQAAEIRQEIPPFLIGERCNANGSKRFRELLLSDDFHGALRVALEQQEDGAHAVDLCTAYAGRDEVADIAAMARLFAQSVHAPMVIDSTTPECVEAALRIHPGRCLVNSVNLEDGGKNLERICRLARKYGAAVIALTIHEKGMAMTVEEKVGTARAIHDLAVGRYGLRPSDLLFDVLTFTVGSGDATLSDAASATVRAVRRVKAELPGVLTSLGVSNVSFGLSPASRKVLNSVFLHEAVAAGLDAAIVDAGKIVPMSAIPDDDREACLDLIYNRPRADGEPPLSAFIRRFADVPPPPEGTKADGNLPALSPEEELAAKVVGGDKDGLEDLLAILLSRRPAASIINQHLVPAMRRVGELFGRGEMLLPFVLKSAEVMKRAVDRLAPFLERSEREEGKKILLATVAGDVHDIGKNLVDIILSNNGYRVVNLGIKVPAETIIEKARELGVDVIGLSGLLVKSALVMKENLPQFAAAGLRVPVLLGGAALTEKFVAQECVPGYPGSVVYCADAFAGLSALREFEAGTLSSTVFDASAPPAMTPGPRGAAVARDVPTPVPPFLGRRHVEGIDPNLLYPFVNEQALFRGRWGYRRGKMTAEEYEALIRTKVRPMYEDLKACGAAEGVLSPKVAYGWFRCRSEGDALVVEDGGRSFRFPFPRQKNPPHLCIADYFRTGEEGGDIAGFFVATVGEEVGRAARERFASDRYHDYLMLHAFGVEVTDALAEYWHERMRVELGIDSGRPDSFSGYVVQEYRGSRYGFGYPACPDLSAHIAVFELLDPGKIGVTLTESMEMVPEQTTSAIVVHHPQAKYFAV